mgnify:FL=1
MKIVHLYAENIMGLKVVEVSPAGNVILVGGDNGSGKSSLLNAIFLALAGGAASKGIARPVRDGENEARVRLDLGEMIITRTWRNGRTYLKVETADGAKIATPQNLLDELIGSLTFDPLAFMRAHPKDQVTQVLALVDLPFDLAEKDAERQRVYDERTVVGREERSLAGQLDGMPDPGDAVPAAEIPISDLVATLSARQRTIAENREARQAADVAEARRVQALAEVDRLEAALAAARIDLGTATHAARDAREWADTLVDPDVTEIERDLALAEESNRLWRDNAERRATIMRHQDAKSRYDALTEALAAIDDEKAEALNRAQLPVDGLGFDEDGVTFQGHPLGDCCTAEKLRVSAAIGMRTNPELRILFIRDGSLLDDANLAMLDQLAQDDDYQVWVERVGDDGKPAIIMEDGEVAS